MQRCSIDEHMTYDVFVPPGCAGGQSKVDPALATSSLLGLDPFVRPLHASLWALCISLSSRASFHVAWPKGNYPT